MDKSQLLERLTALEAEAKQLRELLEAPEKKERWRAEMSKNYWFVGRQGGIINAVDWNEKADIQSYETFNYFQTKEEAERIARVQLAYRRLDWAIRQFDLANIKEYGIIFYIDPDNDFSINVLAAEDDLHSPLPKIREREDAEYILSNYKEELMTFLTGGEK